LIKGRRALVTRTIPIKFTFIILSNSSTSVKSINPPIKIPLEQHEGCGDNGEKSGLGGGSLRVVDQSMKSLRTVRGGKLDHLLDIGGTGDIQDERDDAGRRGGHSLCPCTNI